MSVGTTIGVLIESLLIVIICLSLMNDMQKTLSEKKDKGSAVATLVIVAIWMGWRFWLSWLCLSDTLNWR